MGSHFETEICCPDQGGLKLLDMASIHVLEKFGAVRRALMKLGLQRLRPLQLGSRQIVVILTVRRLEECSMTQIAEDVDGDLGAISRMINSLIKANWLTRSPHPTDARQSVIRLGQKAKKRMDEIEAVRNGIADVMTSNLTPAEQDELLALLTKVEASIK